MHTEEDIIAQQNLLRTHRRTLAVFLDQRAKHGSVHMPPSIAHGIDEARDQIREIKKTLRNWGVAVEDHPNDDPDLSASRDSINLDTKVPISQGDRKSNYTRDISIIVTIITGIIAIMTAIIAAVPSLRQSMTLLPVQSTTQSALQVGESTATSINTTSAPSPTSTFIIANSLTELRNRTAVREMELIEQGLNIKSLPNGVYGYTVPWAIQGNIAEEKINLIELDRNAGGTAVLEIHKTPSSNVYIIGYISDEHLKMLQSDNSSKRILVFMQPYKQYSQLIAIPVNMIDQANTETEIDQHSNYLEVLILDML